MSARAPRYSGSITQRRPGGPWYWRHSITIGDKRYQPYEGPFETEAEAKVFAARFVPGEKTESAVQTWEELFARWVPNRLEELAADGQWAYRKIIDRYFRLHIRPYLTGRIASADEQDINLLWRQLIAKGLEPSYIERIKAVLSQCVDSAVKRGHLKYNPVKLSRVPGAHVVTQSDPTKAKHPKALAEEDAKRQRRWLLENIPESRWALPAILVTDTGCRRGEALGVQVDDLDTTASKLRFARQVVKDEHGAWCLGPLKGRKQGENRIVKIPKALLALLVAHIEANGLSGSDLLFDGEDGALPSPDDFGQWYAETVRPSVGFDQSVTLHWLRHTHATILLRLGEAPHDVAARLGHKQVTTTLNLYVHGDSERDGAGDTWDDFIT